jgi:hypothetical protein
VPPCPILLSSYLLGVVNKRKGRLTVVPVETGGVFKLQMTAAFGAAPVAAPTSDKARAEQLIADFGSRKKQKMEVSRQANIVNVHAVAGVGEVGQQLQTASSRDAADSEIPSSSTTGEAKANATLLAARVATLPPFNASAADPQGVYPLAGIVSQTAFAVLEHPAKLVVRAMEAGSAETELIASMSSGSEFVADRLRALLGQRIARKHAEEVTAEPERGETGAGSTIRKSAAKTRAASLVYLGYLLALHRAPERLHFRTPESETAAATGADAAAAALVEGEPKEPYIPSLAGIPASIVTELLERFTEPRGASGLAGAARPGQYVRTLELRDRLVAHAVVLALLIDDLTTDARLLAADLRMSLAKVATMFREAGCTVEPIRDSSDGASAVVSYRAQLRTPLTFPKMKYSRR